MRPRRPSRGRALGRCSRERTAWRCSPSILQPLTCVTYVPVDFAVDDLGERLRASGWRSDEPTLFLWEGVTNYLSEAAVRDVLAFIGASAPGGASCSRTSTAASSTGARGSSGARSSFDTVARLGEPWIAACRFVGR